MCSFLGAHGWTAPGSSSSRVSCKAREPDRRARHITNLAAACFRLLLGAPMRLRGFLPSLGTGLVRLHGRIPGIRVAERRSRRRGGRRLSRQRRGGGEDAQPRGRQRLQLRSGSVDGVAARLERAQGCSQAIQEPLLVQAKPEALLVDVPQQVADLHSIRLQRLLVLVRELRDFLLDQGDGEAGHSAVEIKRLSGRHHSSYRPERRSAPAIRAGPLGRDRRRPVAGLARSAWGRPSGFHCMDDRCTVCRWPMAGQQQRCPHFSSPPSSPSSET